MSVIRDVSQRLMCGVLGEPLHQSFTAFCNTVLVVGLNVGARVTFVAPKNDTGPMDGDVNEVD